MKNAADEKLRDALMGKGCQPDERTPEKQFSDFFDAALYEASGIQMPLLQIMSKTNVGDLTGQLQAFETRLLKLIGKLNPNIPELRLRLLDSSQQLGHSPLIHFQIGWDSESIFKDTACETLAEAISWMFREVMYLLKHPAADLTPDKIRERLHPLNLNDYKRCCAAARAEVLRMRETCSWPGSPLPIQTSVVSAEVSEVETDTSNTTRRQRGNRKNDSGKADPDTFTKLTGALTTHHEYENGQADNRKSPIGVRKLAKAAGVSPSRATDYFNAKFNHGESGGHSKYKRFCGDGDRISHALRMLNNELTPSILNRKLECDPQDLEEE